MLNRYSLLFIIRFLPILLLFGVFYSWVSSLHNLPIGLGIALAIYTLLNLAVILRFQTLAARLLKTNPLEWLSLSTNRWYKQLFWNQSVFAPNASVKKMQTYYKRVAWGLNSLGVFVVVVAWYSVSEAIPSLTTTLKQFSLDSSTVVLGFWLSVVVGALYITIERKIAFENAMNNAFEVTLINPTSSTSAGPVSLEQLYTEIQDCKQALHYLLQEIISLKNSLRKE